MYIAFVNIHGLVRSKDIEFGRDADTGGQTRYVIDLARHLGHHAGIDRLDVLTRKFAEKTMSPDYGVDEEPITGNARIVRLSAGGGRYIRKEKLWPVLDEYTDRLISYFRRQDRVPDLIHGHYADSAYVAERIASTFGIPLVFTAHSLGRNKLGFLEGQGWTRERADTRYAINTRIRTEEDVLSRADLVIASTSYEQSDLFGMYDNRAIPQYAVIPPGLDLDSFFPYYEYELPGDRISDVQKQAHMRMRRELRRFHFEPDKPLILTLCRPDARKNIDRLIEAYGRDKELRSMANLAIFAGIREDIAEMGEDERQVLTDILLAMDRFDLYGKMAVPKNHDPATDVPEMYRIAALSRGVFVSASYLETFGLTFVEASATGLPFVATDKGGPVDIARNCGSGILVDIDDIDAMGNALKKLISDDESWRKLSENGITRTREVYSWERHAQTYIETLHEIIGTGGKPVGTALPEPTGRRFRRFRALLISDIDDTLLGDNAALDRFLTWLAAHREELGFCVATGRHIDSAREVLAEYGIPHPDLWIAGVGTELYYGEETSPDTGWRSHISRHWKPDEVRRILARLNTVEFQSEPGTQGEYKISANLVDGVDACDVLPQIHRDLMANRIRYNLVFSHERFIDILPYRASKGKAIRYLSTKWQIPLDSIITAGNSGNDRDMLTGRLKGIVVGNHESELDVLRGTPRAYFAEAEHADGILEGLEHYAVAGAPTPTETTGL